MIDCRLKLKYRTAKQPYKCGTYRSRTGNSHGPSPKYKSGMQGTGHRRRQGLGSVAVGYVAPVIHPPTKG